MLIPVEPRYNKKSKAVYLRKDLPVISGFNNRFFIKSGSKGYIESDGFEGTQLKVVFPMHMGTEHLEFNTLNAYEYLECDIY